MELKEYLTEVEKWIKEQVELAGAKGVVVGVSGGIDSALVANLAKKTFPNNYLTVWMPLNSSVEDELCKQALVHDNELKVKTVDLNKVYEALIESLHFDDLAEPSAKLALANTKARLRMTTLYALAQKNNYLVLGTDNADEWHIGYFTKFGDGGVDLLPIVNLLKSEVRQAARLYDVPEIIINRAPTAGLWANQTDEAEIGYSYDTIDQYLLGKKVSNDAIKRIENLHKISDHKRHGAPHAPEFKRDLK